MNEFELAELSSVEERHWWFVERRELLRIWITKNYIDSDTISIIDVGAGVGRQAKMLVDDFQMDVTVVEKSDFGAMLCKEKKLKTIQADATNLPLESDTFSAAIAMDILEHIEDDSAAVAEIYRILKPDGIFFVTVPAFRFMWSSHDESVSHVRRYEFKEIREKLESIGFKIIKIRFWNSLLFIPAVFQRVIFSNSADLKMPNKFLNYIFSKIIRLERNSRIVKYLPGTSIIVELQKR